MTKHLFTISGTAGHGKDTIAEMMREYAVEHGKRAIVIHFADYLKYICGTYYNWDGQKDEAGRTLLQQVGTNKVRKNNPNYWVDVVKNLIDTVLIDDFDIFLIPDARFPNEIESFEDNDMYRVHSIHVTRLNAPDILTEEQKKHPSETALNDYLFEYEVENNSLEELKQAAHKIINLEILGG